MSPENESKKRLEKEFYPTLIRDNKEGVPSLEIAIDHVPKKFIGCSLDELLMHTKEWAEKEAFAGKAVLWQWFTYSADFIEFGGPVPAEFICMVGLPPDCRNYVAQKMKCKLGNAFRYPADPLAKAQIKDSRCFGYIEDGIVWQPLDECTWIRMVN